MAFESYRLTDIQTDTQTKRPRNYIPRAASCMVNKEQTKLWQPSCDAL